MATETVHAYPFSVVVGIPWRPQPSREEAFAKTLEWWASRGFRVVTADTGHRPFNLAAVRNLLVREVEADVIVLCDADTVPEDEPVFAAIHGTHADNLVHLPYHLYKLTDGTFIDGAHSGVYVTTKAAWLSTKGQDEAFQGWGYEDNAWRLAHTTLNGPIVRHAGLATAATHVNAPRDNVMRNRARYKHYQDAYGNREAMELLVNGGTPVPVTAAEKTAAAREARRSRQIRPLGW